MMAATLGQRIRSARQARGLEQQELAELINQSPVALCRIENGHAEPSCHTLRKLAKHLGVSADWLLFGETSFPDQMGAKPDRLSSAISGT